MLSPNKILFFVFLVFFCLIVFVTGEKHGCYLRNWGWSQREAREEKRKEKGRRKDGERGNKERNEHQMRERDKEDYRKLIGAGRPAISIASLNHLPGAGCSTIWPTTTGQVDQSTQVNPLN